MTYGLLETAKAQLFDFGDCLAGEVLSTFPIRLLSLLHAPAYRITISKQGYFSHSSSNVYFLFYKLQLTHHDFETRVLKSSR